MEKWKKGSGVLLFGTFVMLLTMTMCLFFVQTFYLQQEHLNAQTAADSIADATAVYAAMESSDYDDVVNHARDVQHLVSAQTGVNTSNLTVDQTELEENNKVSVSLGILGKFIKDITLTSGHDANGNSLNLGDYNATARATTEFTGNSSSTDIVEVALSQEGQQGGAPYLSWYGIDLNQPWCACFVSWCANECGYIDSGVILKYAYCPTGLAWFQERNEFVDGSATPQPGYIIFFDWDSDGISDHTGIVVEALDGFVHTIEGNTSDMVAQRNYRIGQPCIMGYGTPAY